MKIKDDVVEVKEAVSVEEDVVEAEDVARSKVMRGLKKS